MTSARVRGLLVLVLAAAFVLPGAGCHPFRKRGTFVPGAAGPGRENYERALEEIGRRHLTKAKSLLEAVQFTAENRAELEPEVRLALADVLFYTGDDYSLIEARSKYLEFVTLYGDHPRAAYAQFQTGMCSFRQVGHPTRDQGQTRIAIEDLLEIERRWPGSPYARAARGMVAAAERNLAEHEYEVGRFYARRKAYLAAADRFRGILDRYPSYPEKEKIYFELGRVLILGKNRAEGSIYLDKLLADYPGGRYASEARRYLEAPLDSDPKQDRG